MNLSWGCPPSEDYLKLLVKESGYEPLDEEGYGKIVIDEDGVWVHYPDGSKASLAKGTFLDLVDTPDSYEGQAGKCLKVNSSEDGLEFGECGSGSGSDAKDVKVSDNDTTAKYLKDKLVAGAGISITEQNDGGDETLEISSTGGVPQGNDKSVQYNKNGSFAGDNDLVWDYTNKRLGVGTSSPGYRLHVVSPDGATYLVFPILPTDTLQELTMTGKSGASTSFGFRYTGNGETMVRFTKFADSTKNWAIGFSDEDNIFKIKQGWGGSPQFRAYQNTWLAIKPSGEVGIGTEAPTEKFQVGESGDGTRAIANEWAVFSDKRYKKDFEKIKGALDIITRLQGKKFRFVKEKRKLKRLGLVAQEVKEVLPEAVNEGERLSIDYNQIIALLVEGVKELYDKVKELERKLSWQGV